jgi:hypothetical protein
MVLNFLDCIPEALTVAYKCCLLLSYYHNLKFYTILKESTQTKRADSSTMYVTTRVIQQHYGISAVQLRRWADAGKIDSIRTPGSDAHHVDTRLTESQCCKEYLHKSKHFQ